MKCMECGLCTYSCTSKIPLLEIIREAKLIARKK
jgi:Na+-translocating ferredoxin:NAD+ oxidoreductase RnfC subunit